MAFVSNLPDTLERVIIVGHNPAISYLAEYLSGDDIRGLSPASGIHLSQATDTWQAWSGKTAQVEARIDGEQLLEE